MGDFYPLAKGRMTQVWATCVCPICDSEMGHVGDEYDDDDAGKLMLDTYACNYCHLLVTYVSPADDKTYSETAADDRRYFIERQL